MLTRLNYELALSQAKQLDSASTECTEAVNEVNRQIALIQENWTGEAATAMVDKLSAWVKETTTMAETLTTLAKRVKQKADLLIAIDEKESKK